MKCPHCDAWTELKVRETRTRQDGSKRRTYECGNEHRFNTVERVEHTPHGGDPRGAAFRTKGQPNEGQPDGA